MRVLEGKNEKELNIERKKTRKKWTVYVQTKEFTVQNGTQFDLFMTQTCWHTNDDKTAPAFFIVEELHEFSTEKRTRTKSFSLLFSSSLSVSPRRSSSPGALTKTMLTKVLSHVHPGETLLPNHRATTVASEPLPLYESFSSLKSAVAFIWQTRTPLYNDDKNNNKKS